MPGQSDVVVALPEVGENFLGLRVVGIGSGGNGLQTGRGVAGYVERGRSDRDRFAIDRTLVAELPGLLDDGARGEFGLRRYVERVRIRRERASSTGF